MSWQPGGSFYDGRAARRRSALEVHLVHMMKEAMPVMHGMQTMLAGPNGLMASQAQTAQVSASLAASFIHVANDYLP